MKIDKCFPFDYDTLKIVEEMEGYLGLKNYDCNRMSRTELIEYIDQITRQMVFKG